VAAGANCTVEVAFKPTAAGSRAASLSLTDNAPSSPQTISLSGTGAQTTTAGNYAVTVTGTSGTLSHTDSGTLTVQ
jgi:hypothetical protein